MKTYTTKQGDMWMSVAYLQLGDTAHTDKLMNANQQYLDIFIFPAGIVLTLPDVDTGVTAPPVPWRGAAG